MNGNRAYGNRTEVFGIRRKECYSLEAGTTGTAPTEEIARTVILVQILTAVLAVRRSGIACVWTIYIELDFGLVGCAGRLRAGVRLCAAAATALSGAGQIVIR